MKYYTIFCEPKSSKAKNKRDVKKQFAQTEYEKMPKYNAQFDGLKFYTVLDKDADVKAYMDGVAKKLNLDIVHHKYFENGSYQVDIPQLLKWSHGKKTDKLQYAGTLSYRSGKSRVYALKSKYNTYVYISIGGMMQYADSRLDLVSRLNRNADKTILRIRLERSGIPLHSYELAMDYDMPYNEFTREYLHCFTDGTVRDTKLYKRLSKSGHTLY